MFTIALAFCFLFFGRFLTIGRPSTNLSFRVLCSFYLFFSSTLLLFYINQLVNYKQIIKVEKYSQQIFYFYRIKLLGSTNFPKYICGSALKLNKPLKSGSNRICPTINCSAGKKCINPIKDCEISSTFFALIPKFQDKIFCNRTVELSKKI